MSAGFRRCALLVCVVAIGLALVGCEGAAGSAGLAGPEGPAGPAGRGAENPRILVSIEKIAHGSPSGLSLSNNDQFGNDVANVGDLDGGGGTVIAVGARADDTGGTGRGALYLLSYDAGGALTATTKVAHGVITAHVGK